VAADPDSPENAAGKKFSQTHKIVFTKTLAQSKWDNTVLAKGNVVEEITNLKQQDGKDIIAYGGASFVSSLIKHGLIDEYHLFLNPAAIGNGMPIFREIESKKGLTLVKCTAFDCGSVLLNYEPKRA
jgi:dihydrofolate reductase